MAVFGLGTLPMMLGLAISGRALPLRCRTGIQGSVPWTLGLVGVLHIVRGLGLGIPESDRGDGVVLSLMGLPVPDSVRTRYVAIGQAALARGDVSTGPCEALVRMIGVGTGVTRIPPGICCSCVKPSSSPPSASAGPRP